MDAERERTTSDLAMLIDRYGRRICRAVLDQHDADSLVSPVGIWLLLAAASQATTDDERSTLEEALGCSVDEAGIHLRKLLRDPPEALHCAMALWVQGEDLSSALVRWSASLPSQVQRGPIPAPADADAWARAHTEGIVDRFPIGTDELTRLILASANASRVSWDEPFEAVPTATHMRASSPWAPMLKSALYDASPGGMGLIADTEAAGRVAVHLAVAKEGLSVMSVAADPGLDRWQVLEAAYELGRRCRTDSLAMAAVSLLDLPLGDGHSWTIAERLEPWDIDGTVEKVVGAQLAPWRLRADVGLLPREFGVFQAALCLLGAISPHPDGDEIVAGHAVSASYTATGFEAGSLAFLNVRVMGPGPSDRSKTLVHREATLRFDHPHACIALAGTPADFHRRRAGHTDHFGLPLFVAWVATPHDAELVEGDPDDSVLLR